MECTQCGSGSIMANCDRASAVAYRSVTKLFSRKRSRRTACEETFARIDEFITAKRQQMNSAEWVESPSSPTASDEPLGGAGAIPASPDGAGAIPASSGGAGAIPASPAQRPTSSAGQGEREASAPPQENQTTRVGLSRELDSEPAIFQEKCRRRGLGTDRTVSR